MDEQNNTLNKIMNFVYIVCGGINLKFNKNVSTLLHSARQCREEEKEGKRGKTELIGRNEWKERARNRSHP